MKIATLRTCRVSCQRTGVNSSNVIHTSIYQSWHFVVNRILVMWIFLVMTIANTQQHITVNSGDMQTISPETTKWLPIVIVTFNRDYEATIRSHSQVIFMIIVMSICQDCIMKWWRAHLAWHQDTTASAAADRYCTVHTKYIFAMVYFSLNTLLLLMVFTGFSWFSFICVMCTYTYWVYVCSVYVCTYYYIPNKHG